ncbi:MAG: hypothetical protein JNJ54_09240 [Myxococcaceae bacterium]|nr:hypothetical protein [Myxococcaceae bacterium]
MSRFGVLAVVLSLAAGVASAHDLGLDLTLNGTATSPNNPRTGSAGLILSGSYDFTDRWTGFLTAMYVRDFATRSADSSSPGSNVFLFSGGAMFLASSHLMFMATVTGSPPTVQRNATAVIVNDTTANLVVRGTNASLGGSVLGSYATNGFSNWEHTVDLAVGVNHFESNQVAELPDTAAARLVRGFCTQEPARGYCPLVNGVKAPLTQVRFSATYTATLFLKTDVGLDLSGFVYDHPDPFSVGSFSAVVLGRQGPEVGLGLPIAPWRLTARPFVIIRAGKFSVRLAYQLGLYTSDAGSNHLVSVRLTWKLSPSLRVSLTGLGQTDVDRGAVVNRGGTLTGGVLYIFP